MAVQKEGPSPATSAQNVASAFAERYYNILITDPNSVHKFYEDQSVLSRPDADGVMTSVTSMQGIKDKLLSLDYKGYQAKILTVDAQNSYAEGVIVVVTGCLTGKANLKKSFTQTFFLAPKPPHAKGYYVLNDVFRFVDGLEEVASSAVNDAKKNGVSTPVSPNQESVHVPKQPDESQNSPTKASSQTCDSSDLKGLVNSACSTVQKEVAGEEELSSRQNNGHTTADSASNDQEDPQKISYAKIVAKESTVASPVQMSTNTNVIVAPSNTHQQQRASAAPKASALLTHNAPQTQQPSIIYDEVKTIYVGGLPTNIPAEQVGAIFKKFGPIKKEGIQIRTDDNDGFCFGFVEFESSDSAHSAIEAHHITIDGKVAYITKKRSNNQAGYRKGRFPPEKEEHYGNGNYRNRENMVDGRSYGKSQSGNRGEFSGQPRAPPGRNGGGDANQRIYQNGDGRTKAPSSGGVKQTSVPLSK